MSKSDAIILSLVIIMGTVCAVGILEMIKRDAAHKSAPTTQCSCQGR